PSGVVVDHIPASASCHPSMSVLTCLLDMITLSSRVGRQGATRRVERLLPVSHLARRFATRRPSRLSILTVPVSHPFAARCRLPWTRATWEASCRLARLKAFGKPGREWLNRL